MFYGRGAGSGPTGSAVVGDIIDVCRNIRLGSTGRVATVHFEDTAIVPIDQVETKYYVRMLVADRPRVLAAIAGVLGDHDVSIESVRQKAAADETAEIVWVTHRVREANMRAALKEMKELPAVEHVYNWLRVEE
jgi:homoserine dehydrogenase